MVMNFKNILSACLSLTITTQMVAQITAHTNMQADIATPQKSGVVADNLKPNILFVFCDQLRADVLSCYGDPNVKTPHIDQLAEQGVLFNNALSTFPVCSPYRAQMLTGKYTFQMENLIDDEQFRSISNELKALTDQLRRESG